MAIDRFKLVKKVKGVDTDVYYAFVEAPSEFLDTPIPQDVLDKVYGEGVKMDVALREFVLKYDDLGETAIIMLGAQFAPCYRTRPVNADDVKEWLDYLAEYDYTENDLMNLAEYKERMSETINA